MSPSHPTIGYLYTVDVYLQAILHSSLSHSNLWPACNHVVSNLLGDKESVAHMGLSWLDNCCKQVNSCVHVYSGYIIAAQTSLQLFTTLY